MFQKLQISSQNKILVISFALFLIIYLTLNKKTSEKTTTPPSPFYADTIIPKGFVLVPIEIANIQALSGLIDEFGVIDLYGGESQEKSVQLASHVKILKAPLNPSQYAVMVTEELSQEIMRFKGPYWAVVQNRHTKTDDNKLITNKHLTTKTFKKVEIEYYKSEDL